MAGSKMMADIGTKPLASERLKQLKEEMHMVEVPHAKVENVNHAPLPLQKKPGELKENEKVEKGERFSGEEEIKKAASIVRLLTLAAVLSVAKSEDEDEDWSEDDHSQEFTAMMVIFALVIVVVTLLCQKFWVLLRSQLYLNNQNTKGKEEKGKDGDAVAPAEDVQGPIRRPSGGDAVAPAEEMQGPIRRPSGGDAVAPAEEMQGPIRRPPGGDAVAPAEDVQGPFRRPPRGEAVAPAEELQGPIRLPPGGEAVAPAEELQGPIRLPPVGTARVETSSPQLPPQVDVAQVEQTAPSVFPQDEISSISSSGSSPPYRPVDERHIPDFDVERALEEIASEEAELYEEARENPNQFQNDQHGPEVSQPFFQVWTTRFGVVYHHRRDCRYLTSSQTGSCRESTWCWLCRAISLRTRGRPPPGVELWINAWGHDYHVDPRCPRCDPQKTFRACQNCEENIAG